MIVWKDIQGYEGLYSINNKGEVRSERNNRLLKPINSHGYMYVHLCNENHRRKNKAIHRLVAETFLPNANKLPEVNHKDGDKTNNALDNLEWCSASYNTYHRINVLNKSNKRKVYCIETKQTFDSIKEASSFYGKSQSNLTAVLRGYKYYKTFANKHWRYVV